MRSGRARRQPGADPAPPTRRRDGSRPAREVEDLLGRQPGPVTHVREQVADRHCGGTGEPHVLVDHLGVPIPAAAQIVDELVVRQRVRIDCLQRPVRLDRRGLALRLPQCQLLPPELALEDLSGALDALWHLVCRHQMHAMVGEPVDVRDVHRVEQRAVEPAEFAAAAGERLRVHLLPVPGDRTRMVDGVERPRPGTRWIEPKVVQRRCHRISSMSMSAPPRRNSFAATATSAVATLLAPGSTCAVLRFPSSARVPRNARVVPPRLRGGQHPGAVVVSWRCPVRGRRARMRPRAAMPDSGLHDRAMSSGRRCGLTDHGDNKPR